MEKTRINLDILLPEVPDERDECVNRIIKSLEYIRGIDKVHVVPEEGNKKAQLCFHYDPEEIAINEVEKDSVNVEKKETDTHEEKSGISFERILVIKGNSDVGYTEITLLKEIPKDAKVVVKGAFFILAKQTNTEED